MLSLAKHEDCKRGGTGFVATPADPAAATPKRQARRHDKQDDATEQHKLTGASHNHADAEERRKPAPPPARNRGEDQLPPQHRDRDRKATGDGV